MTRTYDDVEEGGITARILVGDAVTRLRELPEGCVQTCVTSPPYWGLRDYGHAWQLGLEATPEAYVAALVDVFREVRRVLRDDGTIWVNLGDSYAGSRGAQSREHAGKHAPNVSALKAAQIRTGLLRTPGLKPKDLVGIPWLVAFALRADGWYLRSDIIWAKRNPMPESVTDRPTKAHEYIFLLAKSARYYYDAAAIREPCSARKDGANKRTVWSVATHPFAGAHFATFPPALITPCILAGCPVGGTVLDPFAGIGTTGMVALRHGRSFIGCELNPAYALMAKDRIDGDAALFNMVEIDDSGVLVPGPTRGRDDTRA